MRILQVAPVPRDVGGINTGGIPTHVWGLATHLAARGHDVAVAADNRPASAGEAVVEGVRLYGVHEYLLGAGAARLASPRLAAAFLRARRVLGPVWSVGWIARALLGYDEAIREFRPEMIHVHALEGRFSLLHELADGIPLVATAHSTHYFEHAAPEHAATRRALVERNLESAADVVFVSEYLRRRYEEIFPTRMPHIRSSVIPNPIDASLYSPLDRTEARTRLGASADREVLLFAGNLIPRKAPLAFVEAVAALRDAGRPVLGIMVGEGEEQAAVRNAIASHGLQGVVRLDGFRAQAEMAAYYSAADVFVFPSLMESFGLVALEAMLCGCPVVGTPEVLPEVVPDGSGICVPSFELSDLASALAEALDRTWDRAAIRERVLCSDWALRIADYERLYASLATDGAGEA
ncbi:MAG: glycosyltransferase family 4 protein [Actinobacteria bacterium]|nr:MAG: glycosyltransferase family 4 protein [Actinomycetota bacterium]